MSYVITVPTARAWLTDPADPTGPKVVCGSEQSSPVDFLLDGEIRYYAGNQVQGAVREQDTHTLPITLVHLSYAQMQLLKSWRGVPLLYRSADGERCFVMFFDLSYQRVMRTQPEDVTDPANVTYRADLTFTEISYPESV